MNSPRTMQDLQDMIQNQIQENLNLDYKRSPALSKNKTGEIAKDVSAFANSDGGILIYGIEEANHLPTKIDAGVNHNTLSREWLENVITSNISPRIDGIIITQIPITQNESAYVVDIPKSFRGPHQERVNKRYYKRFNFKSEPMEDYEINDIRNRAQIVRPLINIDIETRHAMGIYIVIENIGETVAENVTLDFNPTPTWPSGVGQAPILNQGIRFFPPNREFKIRYHSFPQVLKKKNPIVSTFDVTAMYFNPGVGQNISDHFHIDLRDFLHTSSPDPIMYEQARKIEKTLKDLTQQTKRIGDMLNNISPISGATGLDISVTALRNIKRIVDKQADFEKLSPHNVDYQVFQEVLGIDANLAHRIYDYFWHGDTNRSIMDIQGMTQEIAEKLAKYFDIEG